MRPVGSKKSIITRRNYLIGASAAMIGALAIVRAGNVTAIGGVPFQLAYMAFAIDYGSLWTIPGGALIYAVEEERLRYMPRVELDYDIRRWSTLEV